MRTLKSQSMPLFSAVARFAGAAEIIKSRAEVDEVFCDLCMDYNLARKTLTRIKRQRPRPAQRIAEYTTLVAGLEDEIMRYLLGTGQRPHQ